MRFPFDIWVTNCITNEIEVIPMASEVFYDKNEIFCSIYLYCYLQRYIDNQIPFKLEFHYKNSLGKSIEKG